jgi:magnesium chelatase accessory protein
VLHCQRQAATPAQQFEHALPFAKRFDHGARQRGACRAAPPRPARQAGRRMTRRLDWATDGADWPLRGHSRFVDAGGLRWHVQSLGEGPVLLLLHGTGASSHSWRTLAPLLALHWRVLIPDLPGHAFTDALPAGQRSLPGMAAALAALLRTMQAEPRVVLGHSAGAALMLRWALDGRAEAAGSQTLIGLNAALLPFEGWAGVFYAPLARLLALNPLVPWFTARQARDPAAVRRLIDSTGSTLDADGTQWYARLMRSPAHIAGVLAMMADWDLAALQQRLRGWPHPVHLLVGERDRAVPPEQAERLARRWPGAVLHRLPGLGHLAHEEAPRRVAERVLGLTKTLPAATAPLPFEGATPAAGPSPSTASA